MKTRLIAFVALLTMITDCYAQRTMDKLDRGLVAIKISQGVFLSWRILDEEYYDVQYNVYRDGTKLNESPLNVSNYTDTSGTISSEYTIKAISGGVEKATVNAVRPWSNAYKEIVLAHEGIKSTLIPNDACCADVDGDGELEIIMKFDNQSEIEQSYPKNGPTINGVETKEYTIFECLKQDGTRLWWINCGPNMGDFQNNEQNIAAYDWDGDGKAECVMRAADGTVIHMADGTTYTVGDASVNVRAATGGGVNWFVTTDGEYLLYFDGETGAKYQEMPYPLKRLETGESDINKAWGDGTGHRCSKHFFGAPYFDGKKPSIFLARGIYTRHKMIAYDVDPATHQLTERWRWFNNTDGPWKGQGYHNYCVADVDWDGRDEIVFGSMVIDDNGKGLSTTGLGHGDSEHVGDLNPYMHGHEIYACLEDNPGNNYRDATTSKIYHRFLTDNDDGRCMAGNFTDDFPGGLGYSSREGVISLITNEAVSGLNSTGVNQNFRIYWDGDLCEETFNYVNGKNTEGCIAKYGSWSPIYTFPGSLTNNDTKGTPCYQGDLFGDWREEVIMRTANNNIRIYSTTTATQWRIPSLWADHQYRNAMVWQMNGYNQSPRPSYFLGEMEGITMAPPPLTMNNREEVTSGGTIDANLNGKHVIIRESKNSTITLEQNIRPQVLTFNVPTWVQGTASSESTTQNTQINYTTYTCTVTGGGLSGSARLVKQGDGILTLPKTDFTHTGNTDIWAGTLNFDGTLKNSDLWLNRFAELNSNGGEFKSIKADYGSIIRPGGEGKCGNINVDSLSLGFGSRLVFDLYSNHFEADSIKVQKLSIERKTGNAWTSAGPEYLMPVIELIGHPGDGETRMTPGKYSIANISGKIQGDVNNFIVEGLPLEKKKLYLENNHLVLEIMDTRAAGTIVWDGATSTDWDLNTENFKLNGQTETVTFVSNDSVIFDNNATRKSVSVTDDLYPSSFIVNNTSTYTFSGTGSIGGNASFTKEGTGIVTMNGTNSYTGGNYLKGGTVKVSALANQYSETGNLGAITTSADKFTMENGAVLQITAATESASPMTMVGDEGGVLNTGADFRMAADLKGSVLTKKGSGYLYTMTNNSNLQRLIIAAGSVAAQGGNPAKTVEFQGGTLYDDGQTTSHAIYVPKGKSGTWQLTYSYYTAYANKLTGEGTLTIVPRNTVSRVRITGDWTQFEGTIKHTNKDIWLPLDMSSGMPNGTLDIAEGCTVTNVAKTFAIGKLTGKGSLAQPIANFQNSSAVSGNNTWEVGNSDLGDFTFAGSIVDEGGSNKCILYKVGTCKMNVTGRSTHSGATQIKAGELHLGTGAALGIGTLSVSKGAILSGVTGNNGLTNSTVTVSSGATLQVSSSLTSTSGLLSFGNGNVIVNKGAFVQFGVNGKATSTALGATSIQNINKLTFNGTILLHYASDITDKLSVGDSIILWKNVTTMTGTPVLDQSSYTIGNGLRWDDSDITKGILRVAIDEVTSVVVKAQSYTREYGETNPTLTYTVSDSTYSGKPKITCEATATSPVGSYPIVISSTDSIAGSNVTYVNGTLTVTKAPLTVTVKSASREQGQVNPKFEITYSGFKNGESDSVLTQKPTVTCVADTTSKAGTYDIIVSGGEATNYALSYVNGTLTVTEKAIDTFVTNDMAFKITSQAAEKTVTYVHGPETEQITVPSEVTYSGQTYSVTAVADSAFAGQQQLKSVKIPSTVKAAGKNLFAGSPRVAAITWEAPIKMTQEMAGTVVNNPNLLFYTSDVSYAPNGVTNVINSQTKQAERIVLSDANEGNDFYCPEDFTASSISYTHAYQLFTVTGQCQGWESLVLPFNVTEITHETNGVITPFGALQIGREFENGTKPFWLYEYTTGGRFAEAEGIEANIPYILSMPNEARLSDEYNLAGNITFKATNATVKATSGAKPVKSGNYHFTPSYQNGNSESVYLMNVNKNYDGNPKGSVFVKSDLLARQARPFEAYFRLDGSAGVKSFFSIFNELTDGIRSMEPAKPHSDVEYYQLDGTKRTSPQRGFNIIRTKDKARKILMK